MAEIPERFTNLDAARARFGDRVDRLAPYLWRVDEPAARVVEAMAELPPGVGWAMLGTALDRGIEAVGDAPEAYRALFAELDRVPPWVDQRGLDSGGELLIRAGALGGIVLGARSLVQGYLSPGGNKPLVFAGRLQHQAARRLAETSRFVEAVCRPGGMRRHGDGFKITVKVRIGHAQVQRMILRSALWDARRWGAPINLHDIAGTSLLFSLVVLDGLRQLGLSIGRDEAERYVQLWRYVSLVIGGAPELVPASELEARDLADLMHLTEGPPDQDSRVLVHALLESPLQTARTPAEIRRARRQHTLGCGLVRGFFGDAVADALDVPRTPWRFSVPALRRVVSAAELVRCRSDAAQRAAVEWGGRYWTDVVASGLAGVPAGFEPPQRITR